MFLIKDIDRKSQGTLRFINWYVCRKRKFGIKPISKKTITKCLNQLSSLSDFKKFPIYKLKGSGLEDCVGSWVLTELTRLVIGG